jgi:hypothetical protein
MSGWVGGWIVSSCFVQELKNIRETEVLADAEYDVRTRVLCCSR